jgi:hypothetical protein
MSRNKNTYNIVSSALYTDNLLRIMKGVKRLWLAATKLAVSRIFIFLISICLLFYKVHLNCVHIPNRLGKWKGSVSALY